MMIYNGRIYVPNQKEVKDIILDECHKSQYAGHLAYQKLITMLRKEYFWPDMKKDVVEYLTRCLECQQIKTEH